MTFREVFDQLRERFTAQDWWPADGPFEIVIGTVLTQNTAWGNVERALANLKAPTAFDPHKILAMPIADLMTAIRPAGSYVRKAQTIRDLAVWYVQNAVSAQSIATDSLRADLLKIKGVGPESADVILLYVFERPRFIFDTYARRMLAGLGWSVGHDYESTRLLHEAAIRADGFRTAELALFHALIVTAGKHAGKDGWAQIFAA